MSVTLIETPTAQAAADAVLRLLPAADLQAGEALTGHAAVSSAIPGDGSRAVAADFAGGASGQVVVVLSAALADSIENGPLGAQDLLAALTPALDDLVATVGPAGDVRHTSAQILTAEVALSNATTHDFVSVVPFTAAGVPAGAVVVMLDANGVASFETLQADVLDDGSQRGVELLSDVEMGVTAELGRTRLTVRELLSLQPGSIVELDRAAGSPVDLLVNGTLVARGEVVVIDEEFGVRITEIVTNHNRAEG